MQLIRAMVSSGKPLSELAQVMDVYPQKLLNVAVSSKPDLTTVPQVVDAITQVEGELGESGRVLVRYSGTQNPCRVMVEGPSAGSDRCLLPADRCGDPDRYRLTTSCEI